MIVTSEIKPKNWGAWETLSDSDFFTRSSILAPYQLRLTINLENEDNVFSDRGRLWLSTAMFTQLNNGVPSYGTEPTNGYFIEVPTNFQAAQSFIMPLKSSSRNAKLVNPNKFCVIDFQSTTQATILLDFTFLADRNGYNSQTVYNPDELVLKSTVFDNDKLSNDVPNVYNIKSELGLYVYYQNTDTSLDLEPEFLDREIVLQSRFYGEGLRVNPNQSVATEFQGYEYEILDGNGAPATLLNPYEVYTVKVKVATAVVPTSGVLYLFPKDYIYQVEQTVFEEMPLSPIPLAWNLVSGKYEAVNAIAGADLISNQDYWLAAVVANGDLSNTFIDFAFSTSSAPSQYPILPVATILKDYHGYKVDNMKNGAVVDRYASHAFIKGSDYQSMVAPYEYSNGNLIEDLRLIKVELINHYSNEVYDTLTVQNANGQFQVNSQRLSIEYAGYNLSCRYDFRALFLNKQNLEDFGGETLAVKWTFSFFYPDNSDQVHYSKRTIVDINDFENEKQAPVIQWIKFFDVDTEDELKSLCAYSKPNVLVKTQLDLAQFPLAEGERWKLHAFIDYLGYGSTLNNDLELRGQQAYDGFLSRELFSAFVNQDEYFDSNGLGKWEIDISQINLNKAKRLYVVIKPEGFKVNGSTPCTMFFNIPLFTPYQDKVAKDARTGVPLLRGTAQASFVEEPENVEVTIHEFKKEDLIAYHQDQVGENNSDDDLVYPMMIGVGRTGSNRRLKAEVLTIDGNGNFQTIASTGMTGGNGGVDPNGETYVYDEEYYIIDDPDPNVEIPNRIDDFTNEEGLILWYLAKEGVPISNCEEARAAQAAKLAEDAENYGAQIMWFTFNADEVASGKKFFLRVMGTKSKTHYATLFKDWCGFSNPCPPPAPPEYFGLRFGAEGVYYLQDALEFRVHAHLESNLLVVNNGPQNFTFREFRYYNPNSNALESAMFNSNELVSTNLVFNNVPNLLHNWTESFRYAHEVDGNKMGISMKLPDNATGIDRRLGCTFLDESPNVNWCVFDINFRNQILLNFVSVEFKIMLGATISFTNTVDVEVTGGVAFHSEVIDGNFNGSDSALRSFNLTEGVKYQIVLEMKNGASSCIVAYDLIPFKSN